MKTPSALMAATMLVAAPALAEALAVVGTWLGLSPHKNFCGPFWQETIPEVSGDSINANLTAHEQMTPGVEIVLRLQGDGGCRAAVDVADKAVAAAPDLDR
ncbi:MAG: hypothetical protein OXH79_00200 [Boseongicola sp.]|nr:hypothetical protein [Boseongicola sp.]